MPTLSSIPEDNMSKDSTLEEKLKARLEAMYFSAKPVENLDTDETEPPKSLEEALEIQLPRVLHLIDQEKVEALEQQLENICVHPEDGCVWGYRDVAKNAYVAHEHLKKQLNQLQKERKDNG